MDYITQSHFKNWLGLEPRNIHLATALEFLKVSPEEFIQYFSYTKDEMLNHYQLYAMKASSEESTIDIKTRNAYWIEHSLSKVLQPEKLGLMMFGRSHASGPNGIITFLQRILAYMHYRKHKHSPSQKIKWKGVHFLRLEQMKGRIWEEIRMDSRPAIP